MKPPQETPDNVMFHCDPLHTPDTLGSGVAALYWITCVMEWNGMEWITCVMEWNGTDWITCVHRPTDRPTRLGGFLLGGGFAVVVRRGSSPSFSLFLFFSSSPTPATQRAAVEREVTHDRSIALR